MYNNVGHYHTAGGLRVNPEARKLAGYDIPAGYALTADPRIPFLDPNNYPEPEEFRPERFLPEVVPGRYCSLPHRHAISTLASRIEKCP